MMLEVGVMPNNIFLAFEISALLLTVIFYLMIILLNNEREMLMLLAINSSFCFRWNYSIIFGKII